MTRTTCECGCGWEGEDEVTQFLIEEAVFDYYDRFLREAEEEREAEEQQESRVWEMAQRQIDRSKPAAGRRR